MRTHHPTSVLAFVSFILTAGCSDVALPEPSAALRATDQCEDPSSDEYYLLEGTFTPKPGQSDRAQRRIVSRLLRAVNARPLSCGRDVEHAYRFIWVGTNVAPMIVQISQVGNTWQATGAQFSHAATALESLVNKSERTVSDDDVENLLGHLRAADFWTVPLAFDAGAGDGEAWIIEGRLGTRYRAVARANPGSKEFKEVAFILVRLSGLKIPPQMADL